MTLKTIEEHNKHVMDHTFGGWKMTGVACPNCGDELQRISQEVLTSYPAQARVKCYTCGIETRIFVP